MFKDVPQEEIWWFFLCFAKRKKLLLFHRSHFFFTFESVVVSEPTTPWMSLTSKPLKFYGGFLRHWGIPNHPIHLNIFSNETHGFGMFGNFIKFAWCIYKPRETTENLSKERLAEIKALRTLQMKIHCEPHILFTLEHFSKIHWLDLRLGLALPLKTQLAPGILPSVLDVARSCTFNSSSLQFHGKNPRSYEVDTIDNRASPCTVYNTADSLT